MRKIEKMNQQPKNESHSLSLMHTLLVLSIPTIIEEVLATLLQYVDVCGVYN